MHAQRQLLAGWGSRVMAGTAEEQEPSLTVIYVDCRHPHGDHTYRVGTHESQRPSSDHEPWITKNVSVLVDLFKQVTTCGSARSGLSLLSNSHSPALMLIGIPESEPQDTLTRELPSQLNDSVYGTMLLRYIASGAATTPNVLELVALVSVDEDKMFHLLDLGASDVIRSPLEHARCRTLLSRMRRRLGPSTRDSSTLLHLPLSPLNTILQQNIAASKFLSRLFAASDSGDCRNYPSLDSPGIDKPKVHSALHKWNFHAHDLSQDELLYATHTLLNHALTFEGVEPYSLPQGRSPLRIG